MHTTQRLEDVPPFARRLVRTRSAIVFASRQHARQRRESDHAPFLLHPLEVGSLLSGRGFGDEVVAAGVLHDILEKTAVTAAELRRVFGAQIAGLVEAVSEDRAIGDYERRKAALRAQVAASGRDALALYAADKLAKARELRVLAAREHVSLADPPLARRLTHYAESLRMIEAAPGQSPLVDQLRFELWALCRLPPA
ncbi:MAG: HD domain-containing protein [Solirubrobacteraceae bacterium]